MACHVMGLNLLFSVSYNLRMPTWLYFTLYTEDLLYHYGLRGYSMAVYSKTRPSKHLFTPPNQHRRC